jgi:hypothetical protein
MKLTVAFAIYILFGALVVFSLVQAVMGHPWWLLACAGVYLLGFIRLGCKVD